MENGDVKVKKMSICIAHYAKTPLMLNDVLLLSVLCHSWTEYKFTCVCLSVCVSVTLSVNSPTGQTSQRIFIPDSLKHADLHQDVPFEGLDDE